MYNVKWLTQLKLQPFFPDQPEKKYLNHLVLKNELLVIYINETNAGSSLSLQMIFLVEAIACKP